MFPDDKVSYERAIALEVEELKKNLQPWEVLALAALQQGITCQRKASLLVISALTDHFLRFLNYWVEPISYPEWDYAGTDGIHVIYRPIPNSIQDITKAFLGDDVFALASKR